MTAPSTAASSGKLVVNADDWGRDRRTTDMTMDCVAVGAVSAASAMVFMEDSERAAQLALERGVDTGLHLNLTAPFTASNPAPALEEHHRRVRQYLRKHPMMRILFHPGLRGSFEFVVKAQLEEYQRIFGVAPKRIDGHHHMHLCANVQRQELLPQGTLARRNFSFQAGEKSWINRAYRDRVDRRLARRHFLFDYLFSLPPLEPVSRLQRIFSMAESRLVEVETHPVNPAEYEFLRGGAIFKLVGNLRVASDFGIPSGRGPVA